MSRKMSPAAKTPEKIMSYITRFNGCCHEGFIAGDMRLALSTVKRHVRKLLLDGRVERGDDGHALTLTDSEIIETELDAAVKNRCRTF